MASATGEPSPASSGTKTQMRGPARDDRDGPSGRLSGLRFLCRELIRTRGAHIQAAAFLRL